nr:hypothetical protein [uncultured Pseudomonas sp.]
MTSIVRKFKTCIALSLALLLAGCTAPPLQKPSSGNKVEVTFERTNTMTGEFVVWADDYDCYGYAEPVNFGSGINKVKVFLERKPYLSIQSMQYSQITVPGISTTYSSCGGTRTIAIDETSQYKVVTGLGPYYCQTIFLKKEASGQWVTIESDKRLPPPSTGWGINNPGCAADAKYQGSSIYMQPRGPSAQ